MNNTTLYFTDFTDLLAHIDNHELQFDVKFSRQSTSVGFANDGKGVVGESSLLVAVAVCNFTALEASGKMRTGGSADLITCKMRMVTANFFCGSIG